MILRLASVLLAVLAFTPLTLTAAASGEGDREGRLTVPRGNVGNLLQEAKCFKSAASNVSKGSSAESTSSNRVSVQELLADEDAQSALAELAQRQRQGLKFFLQVAPSPKSLDERVESLVEASLPLTGSLQDTPAATFMNMNKELIVAGGATVGILSVLAYVLLSKKS